MYFVGDGVTNLFTTAACWSFSSGGTGGAGVPGMSNAVIFDSNSPASCTLAANVTAWYFDFKDTWTGTLYTVGYDITVAESFGFYSATGFGCYWNFTGAHGRETKVIAYKVNPVFAAAGHIVSDGEEFVINNMAQRSILNAKNAIINKLSIAAGATGVLEINKISDITITHLKLRANHSVEFDNTTVLTVGYLDINGNDTSSRVMLRIGVGTGGHTHLAVSSASVDFADVESMNASLGNPIIATNSADRGGNTNWTFA